jgi:hypothetical protein
VFSSDFPPYNLLLTMPASRTKKAALPRKEPLQRRRKRKAVSEVPVLVESDISYNVERNYECIEEVKRRSWLSASDIAVAGEMYVYPRRLRSDST